ncbi:MAG: alpha/beta fold hydrolase [Bacillus sp. (in: firmicutes)]
MYKWDAEGNAKAVIVIVHGAMEHQERYQWLINMWRSAGCHVIMGDLPGQGLQTRSNRGHIESFDEYLAEVEKWVVEAYDYHLPIFLFGHSLGGLICIRLLQEMELDVAGLILSSPCLGLASYPHRAMHAATAVLNVAYPSFKTTTGIKIHMVTRNEQIRQSTNSDSMFITKVSVRWYRETLAAIKEAFDNIPELSNVPLLVMQAGDDQVVNKQAVKEWFNYTFNHEKAYKEWTGLYHELFNEPEKENVFYYAHGFVENTLRNLGYIVQ